MIYKDIKEKANELEEKYKLTSEEKEWVYIWLKDEFVAVKLDEEILDTWINDQNENYKITVIRYSPFIRILLNNNEYEIAFFKANRLSIQILKLTPPNPKNDEIDLLNKLTDILFQKYKPLL